MIARLRALFTVNEQGQLIRSARVNVNGTEHQSYHASEAEAIVWLNRTRAKVHGEFACSGR